MARASDPILAQHAATHIVRTLRAQGHQAYFAGGCVRDALLGARPTDFDVATDATPARVRSLFHASQEIGESFGVVLVIVKASDLQALPAHAQGDRAAVEVATFRSDGPYHDARRPDHVTFSDAPSDAQRRDFTINALFLDPLATDDSKRVIDYVGGVADLASKLIRAVGDPDKRLAEDHLRALRAVRFAARLGFTIDPTTAGAITRHAAALTGVSRERIGEEMRRMLAHPSAPAALTLLHALRLDAPVLDDAHLPPAASPLPLCHALAAQGRREPSPADIIAMLAAWLIDRARLGGSLARAATLPPDAVRCTLSRTRPALCLSNDETELLRDVLTSLHTLEQWATMSVAQRKRLASRREFPVAITLRLADAPAAGAAIQDNVRELESDGIGIHPPLLVTGDDLVASGFKPGPNFRVVLDAVYDAQLEGRVRDRHAAMELAKRLSV